ncbi:MAG: hypothetical protein M1457_01205 [bacterium]|nr:hypothetical protein [bacterium]
MEKVLEKKAVVQAPPASAPPQDLPQEPLRFVSIRAIAIACALMPVLALMVVQSELIWYSGHSTAISLFFHVTFTIFLLGLANLYIQKRWPKAALSAGEMMTIYMMLSIAGTFCSHDMLQIMVPMLSFPKYNANPQNQWEKYILSHIPSFSIITDIHAAEGLAVGNNSLYRLSNLVAWSRPFALWYTLLLALMGCLLAINIFFRQHWTERERLAFPIIQIPMMIATGLSDLLRNKLFWIAFGITTFIDIVDGFNFLYPSIPRIPIVEAFRFSEYFVERPWNAIAATTINLYPFVIGLTFFIPTDLAFSCWFFFIMFKLQLVITSAIGIRDLPGFPFPTEQSGGAYIALGLLAIWVSRRHLVGVGRNILRRPGGLDDSHEPMSYTKTLILFLVCAAVLFYIAIHLLGGTPGIMLMFFTIFFLYAIAIARMRAELGPPAHDLHNMGPDTMILNPLGTRGIGTENSAVFTLFWWFNRAYRAHFSAHDMEGFKLAQLTRIASRSILKAMVIAIVFGSLVAFWAVLHSVYVHGYSGRLAGDAFSQEGWNRMVGWMTLPQKPRYAASVASVVGLLVALFLGAMRMKYTWWLWHPVGYATSTCWSMEKLWFCLFLGWLAKSLITRYGGAVAYRKSLPFFVGLVMGEFVTGSLWMIYGALANMTVYRFWG